MRIKIMTCHHVYNYGATLQAFALQNYLEKFGNRVGIIDYRLLNHRRYELFKTNFHGRAGKFVRLCPLLNYIIAPYRNRNMMKTWGRKMAFDNFDKNFLHIEGITYHTYDEIKNNPPSADMFIAGSDQIWNPNLPNGKDFGYYLKFGDEKIKRISYAASFGVNQVSPEQEALIKEMLSKFQLISVREKSGVGILSKIGINAVQCVDPVFLLSKSEWIEKLKLKDMHETNYIMLYDFTHDDERIKTFALMLAKRKNLKIISINDFCNAPYADIQINNAGPKEFLQYMMNAEYVVANSFHATAFSLLFHKRFATFPLISQPNSARMIDLLDSVHLSGHFQPLDISEIDDFIDWNSIDDLIEQNAKYSKEYLKMALDS